MVCGTAQARFLNLRRAVACFTVLNARATIKNQLPMHRLTRFLGDIAVSDRRRFVVYALTTFAILLFAGSSASAASVGPLGETAVLAYVGPGAGLGMIGSLLAVLAAVVIGLVGLVLYPITLIRKMLRKPSEATPAAPPQSAVQTSVETAAK